MAVTWELVQYVAQGATRNIRCEGCLTGERVDADMYGLAESGPVPLGTFVTCERCGAWWQCSQCPAVVSSDGRAVFEHVRDQHSAGEAGPCPR